jgi:hypothetical protein
MRRAYRAVGHDAPNSLAYIARQQIEDEVENNMRAAFSSAPESLYECLDIHDLKTSCAAEIAHRWSKCHLHPDYTGFLRQWSQASEQNIAGIEFRYALLYQEKKILETIMHCQGTAIRHAAVSSCK